MTNVCVVDPDCQELFFIKDCLQGSEFSTVAFHHGVFIDAVTIPIGIGVISLDQDCSNGFQVVKILKKTNPSIRIILTTKFDLIHFEDKILNVVDILLPKPYTRVELLCLLRNLNT